MLPYILTALVAAAAASGGVYWWQSVKQYDEALVRKTASADCESKLGRTAEIGRLQIKNNFAYASVSCSQGSESGGYGVTLKKVKRIWVVIYKGQESPGKNVGQLYGLPEDMYSKDYDSLGY